MRTTLRVALDAIRATITLTFLGLMVAATAMHLAQPAAPDTLEPAQLQAVVQPVRAGEVLTPKPVRQPVVRPAMHTGSPKPPPPVVVPAWRVARSLDTLLAEINAAAPARSKASDGGIGDAAHVVRVSDHNPWVRDAHQPRTGVVRARDITCDPSHGVDCQRLARHLVTLMHRHHPALGHGAYIVYNKRIISSEHLAQGWRPYAGSNPHAKHLHVSVALDGRGFDSTAGWGITRAAIASLPPKPPVPPVVPPVPMPPPTAAAPPAAPPATQTPPAATHQIRTVHVPLRVPDGDWSGFQALVDRKDGPVAASLPEGRQMIIDHNYQGGDWVLSVRRGDLVRFTGQVTGVYRAAKVRQIAKGSPTTVLDGLGDLVVITCHGSGEHARGFVRVR